MRTQRMPAGLGSTVVAVVVAVIIGLFVGGITSFTHRQWAVAVGGARVPLGLLIGILIVAAVLIGIRLAFRSRIVTLGGAVGVLSAIAVLASRGPGGSVVIVQDWVGWTWILAFVVLSPAAALWPPRPIEREWLGGDRPPITLNQ